MSVRALVADLSSEAGMRSVDAAAVGVGVDDAALAHYMPLCLPTVEDIDGLRRPDEAEADLLAPARIPSLAQRYSV